MRFYKDKPVSANEQVPEVGKPNQEEQGSGMAANGESNLQSGLASILDTVDGAIGVALVDIDDGLTLGSAGSDPDFDPEVAGAGSLDVVRAKMRALERLGIDDQIEDMLITLGKQYHVIRCLDRNRTLFLYLAINREDGNLGLARHRLRNIEGELGI